MVPLLVFFLHHSFPFPSNGSGYIKVPMAPVRYNSRRKANIQLLDKFGKVDFLKS